MFCSINIQTSYNVGTHGIGNEHTFLNQGLEVCPAKTITGRISVSLKDQVSGRLVYFSCVFNCDGGLPIQPSGLGFTINDKYMIQCLCEGRGGEEGRGEILGERRGVEGERRGWEGEWK